MRMDQSLPWMSAIVIRTYRSGSSESDRMCFFIASRTDGLSQRLAISRYTFTHTSRMFGTG